MGGRYWVVVCALAAVACGTTRTDDGGAQGGPDASCARTTCQILGYSCGQAPDGCGGVQDCGFCADGQTCGAGGMNICGTGTCTPKSCADQGRQCGPATDGCGKVIDCGACSGACVPRTCRDLGKTCGEVEDGCGAKLQCGTCSDGQACGAGGVANVCGGLQPMACADLDLGTDVPLSHKGTIEGASRYRTTGCGLGEFDGERVFAWRAPADGTYVFDTTTSAFNTVLYVRKGDCVGEELVCNDDGISYGKASKVELTLKAGEPLAIFVDVAAWSGDRTFTLNISRKASNEAAFCTDWADNDGDGLVDCADPDCSATAVCAGEACTDGRTAALQPMHLASKVSADTRGAGNRFVGSCGHEVVTREDRAFLFTAPKAGSFVFTVNGSGFAKALYVLTACRGSELGCAVAEEGVSKTASVAVTLESGQSVVVVVDEYDSAGGGTFNLWVNAKATTENFAEGTCGDGGDNDADGAADAADPDCG